MTNQTPQQSSETATFKVAVLGVGNYLFSDEGFGVHMVKYLTDHYTFEPEIQLIDGGTSGMELLGFLDDFDHLLLLDCVGGDKAPGTVYAFDDSEVKYYFKNDISVHEVGVQDILYIHSLKDEPDKPELVVSVIGCEPENLDTGIELSETVKKSVPHALELVVQQLAEWGVTATKKEG